MKDKMEDGGPLISFAKKKEDEKTEGRGTTARIARSDEGRCERQDGRLKMEDGSITERRTMYDKTEEGRLLISFAREMEE